MISILTTQDLTSHYRKKETCIKHIGFTEAIKDFSNKELIIALTNRFYKLTDPASDALIAEIKNRSITINLIEQTYHDTPVFKHLNSKGCPCCSGLRFLKQKGDVIESCLVCGFDHIRDNPKSFLNRVRWKLGIYGFSRLTLKEIKELLE